MWPARAELGATSAEIQIIPINERVVDRKFDPLVWLGNKVGLRNKDNEGRTGV